MQRFRSYVPVGILLPLFVLVLLLSVVLVGGKWSGQQVAAPADAAASPTPGTALAASATITVFFTVDGIPTAGPAPITRAYVDGQQCVWVAATVIFTTLSDEVPWPPHSGGPACFQENPAVSMCAGDICSEPVLLTGDHASAIIDFTAPPGVPLATAHFQSDGSPAPVGLSAIAFWAGPVLCFSAGGNVPVPNATSFVMPWSSFRPAPCTVDGIDISVTASTADYGELTGDFLWDGVSVDYVIDVPVPLATPTLSPEETASPSPPPSPTAAPTPAQLPEAGGPAGRGVPASGAALTDAAASPTPGTAPAGSARVSVRNTLNGEPLIMTVTRLSRAIVDGEICEMGVTADVYPTIVNSQLWPWRDEPPCNLTGVPASICYGAWNPCSEEFVFTGEDVVVDVEWSPLLPDPPQHQELRIRFVHQDSLQPVTLLSWLFRSGAQACTAGATYPAMLSSVVMAWPEKCQAPGLDIEATFETEEFGVLEGAFQWQSGNLTLDVDTKGFLTPTASPLASTPGRTPDSTAAASPAAATATPASLPEAGGPPGSASRLYAVALMVLVAVTVAGAAVAGRSRA